MLLKSIKMAKTGLVGVITAAALTACGGSSSSETAVAYNGKLVDSEVAGVSFVCGDVSGVTAADGTFGTCSGGSIATFSIGGLELGSSGVTGDGIFMIQDIVGVPRTATDNEEVLQIAVLLQSMDSDGDPTNGISVPPEAATIIDTLIEDSGGTIESIADMTSEQVVVLTTATVIELQETYDAVTYVPVEEAQANLEESTLAVASGDIAPPPAPTGSEGES